MLPHTYKCAHTCMGAQAWNNWSLCVMNQCGFPGTWTGVSNQVKQLHQACSEGCHLLTLQIFSQTMQWLLSAFFQSVQESWLSAVLSATPAAGARSSDTQYCTHLAWAVITHAPLPAKTVIPVIITMLCQNKSSGMRRKSIATLACRIFQM